LVTGTPSLKSSAGKGNTNTYVFGTDESLGRRPPGRGLLVAILVTCLPVVLFVRYFVTTVVVTVVYWDDDSGSADKLL